jgi:hypothetical protein
MLAHSKARGSTFLLTAIDCGCIDPVVLSMRTNEADIDNAIVITDRHDQSIAIAMDIEHDTIVREKTGRGVHRPNISGA